MIGPRMATMLGFLLTDAPRPRERPAATILSERSTVRSTASRSRATPAPTTPSFCSRARPADEPPCEATTLAAFAGMVREACEQLARMIADDGEGATHFITIDVEGCRDLEDARAIARAVADSPLVKTAIHGADPNWGRIVSAAGYAGVPFEEGELLALAQRRARLPARGARPVR